MIPCSSLCVIWYGPFHFAANLSREAVGSVIKTLSPTSYGLKRTDLSCNDISVHLVPCRTWHRLERTQNADERGGRLRNRLTCGKGQQAQMM